MTVKIAHNSGERQSAKLRGDKYYFTGFTSNSLNGKL